MSTLHAQPLTDAAFAPYGQVIETGASGRWINDGNAWRSETGPLALTADGGQPVLAVFRATARAATGPWHEMERHRLGTQSFLPLGTARCVLLVAQGDTAPDPATLAAFVTRPGQGWTLAAGTWHHALIVLDDVEVAVLERAADTVDCEIVHLVAPVQIVL